MKFKIGDKVKWRPTGERGTVTHVLGKRFEVTWDDGGESYTYTDWPGGSVILDTKQ